MRKLLSLLYAEFTQGVVKVKFLPADNILKYFSYFSLETGFNTSCKLSPMERICMKCRILFSGQNKKTIIFVIC